MNIGIKRQGLQGVTVIEELVSGTQLLPTMTAARSLVRLHDRLKAGHTEKSRLPRS